MKVFVYYDEFKRSFSIKALEGPQAGKTVAHRAEVWLKDVLPVEARSERSKVIQEVLKSTESGLVGEWMPQRSICKGDVLDKIKYDPYASDSFVSIDDMSKKYEGSRMALLWQKQLWAVA